MSETTLAATSLQSSKTMKEEPETKLVPHVKSENIECYKEVSEMHSRTKQNIVPHKKIKEESNRQLTNYQQIFPTDNDYRKCFNVYEEDIKKEDFFNEDIKESDSRNGLNDTKCYVSVTDHKFDIAVDYDVSISAYKGKYDLKNNDGRHAESVTDVKLKITQEEHKKKCNEYFLQSIPSSKFYTVQKLRAYKCNECGIILSSLIKLVTHMREIHKIYKIFECTMCQHSFSSVVYLKQHFNNVHKKIRNFKCDICDKLFFQSTHLKLHVNHVHKGIRKFQCNECGSTFHLLSGLKLHIMALHRSEICDGSNFECHDKSYFECHDKSYFECQICAKMFVEKRKLKVHIHSFHMENMDFRTLKKQKEILHKDNHNKLFNEIHKGRKIYECNDCHKCLFTKYNLKIHIATIHEKCDSRSARCPKCKKSFSTKYSLKNHMNGIHGKNYQCKVCFKYLSTKNNLRLHIDAVHKGIKNFKCSECFKSFTGKSDLRCHIIRWHKN